MTSKSHPQKNTGIKEGYDFPIDSCNHFISTSLRDLSLKYKSLDSESGKASHLDEKKSQSPE